MCVDTFADGAAIGQLHAFKKAFAIFKNKFGEDHPNTKLVKGHIEKVEGVIDK